MKTTIKYICTGLSLCACTCLVNNLPAQAETTNTAAVSATETGWDRQSIMEVARRVADWQIKDYPENKYAKSEPRGWIAGALYMGMFDWAELSGDNTYYDWLRKIFNRQSWQVANRMYHADDVCIAQTYIDFYNKEKNENMLKPTIARADWVLNNPSNGSMDLDYSKGSTIFFGCDGMDGILSVENFDTSLAEGLMLLTPFSTTEESSKAFTEAYVAAYGIDPNQFAADSYDAVYAIKAAVEKAGVTADMSASDICDALKPAMTEISIDGLTGSDMVWNANGEPNKAPKAVKIVNGEYEMQ